MRNIARVLCLFLGLSLIANSYATGLTEEAVKQLILRVDNAINEKNAKAIEAELSKNVSITINIDVNGQKQVMKPSKHEYVSMLEQAWEQYSNYKYNRSNMVIKITSNKAVVTADVSESMTAQGQNISGSSKEEVIIELIEGKPLITAVTGYTSM